MPLRYVDVNQSRVQPASLSLADTILGRRQKRYDSSIAQQEAALQEALSRGFVDPQAREEYTNRSREAFSKVAQKYRGDLSAGYKDILGTVTDVRTDPYIQANQAQLEAAKMEQQRLAQLGQYGYIKPGESIFDQSLMQDGKYRTNFQPQVYDVREFDKIGATAGTGYARSSFQDYESSLPGYSERQYGFRTPDEAAQHLSTQEGEDYITNLMAQQGLDPNNEMFRRRVEQNFINSSVGKRERVARRDYISPAEERRLALSEEKNERDKKIYNAKVAAENGKANKGTSVSGKGNTTIDTSNAKLKGFKQNIDEVRSTLNEVKKQQALFDKYSEDFPQTKESVAGEYFGEVASGIGKDIQQKTIRANRNVFTNYIDFVKDQGETFGIEPSKELETLNRFREEGIKYLNNMEDLDINKQKELYKNAFGTEPETGNINIGAGNPYSPIQPEGTTKEVLTPEALEELKDYTESKIVEIEKEAAPLIEAEYKEFEQGYKVLEQYQSDEATIQTVRLSDDVIDRAGIATKTGDKAYMNPSNLTIEITDEDENTREVTLEEYQGSLTDPQKKDAEKLMEVTNKLYSVNRLDEKIKMEDGSIIYLDAEESTKDSNGRKIPSMKRRTPLGNFETVTVSVLLDEFAENVVKQAPEILKLKNKSF